MSVGQFLRFAYNHPVSRRDPIGTVARIINWQVRGRLASGPVVCDWIDDLQLSVSRGMTAATGNLYYGLYEFADMAFMAHLLQPGDLFVDVGANVGTYSLLAARHCDAVVLAVEAAPETAELLRENVRLNDLRDKIKVIECAAGAQIGVVNFTVDRGAMNQVADASFANSVASVELATLDHIVANRLPVMMKIDVEGYEGEVLDGAKLSLAKESLLAVQVETTTSAMERLFETFGFKRHWYDAFKRELVTKPASDYAGDPIFVRDLPKVIQRIKTSKSLKIGGVKL